MSRTVALADWVIPGADGVRSGQLSVIRDPAGARLEVYVLRGVELELPPFLVRSETPGFSGNSFVIADFTTGNRNRLGGFFNAFARSPSAARAELGSAPDGRGALRLRYDRQAQGFAGVWIHLFDFTSPPAERRYLDARPLSTLSFWIRGERGGEELLFKVADADWERREDALPVEEVPVTAEWRQIVIPLDRLPARLDRASLASVILEANSPGTSAVYVSGLALSRVPSPLPPLPTSSATTPPPPRRMATWLWHTSDLIERPEQQAPLIAFLKGAGFDRVFLQVPMDVAADAPRLQPLVAALHAAGMRVDALDGDRRYALPAFHAAVLRGIDAVLRYNRESPANARFDGIRHDIEPYLLPGFTGPRRETILRDFLTLVAESARRARGAGLVYGVDIPFWYDAPDEHTFLKVEVEFGGATKPASEHLIDLADDIAVMDYRTTAYGADGTIRHAETELAYAAGRGKRVYVGLETTLLPDEELIDFAGEPSAGTASGGEVVVMIPRGDSADVRLMPAANVAAGLLWWPVRRRVGVPGDRLSFARLGNVRLQEAMRSTLAELGRYPSFAGFAIHDARGYQALQARGDGTLEPLR